MYLCCETATLYVRILELYILGHVIPPKHYLHIKQFFSMAQQPLVGQGLLIIGAS
jgi:hypothetical protein